MSRTLRKVGANSPPRGPPEHFVGSYFDDDPARLWFEGLESFGENWLPGRGCGAGDAQNVGFVGGLYGGREGGWPGVSFGVTESIAGCKRRPDDGYVAGHQGAGWQVRACCGEREGEKYREAHMTPYLFAGGAASSGSLACGILLRGPTGVLLPTSGRTTGYGEFAMEATRSPRIFTAQTTWGPARIRVWTAHIYTHMIICLDDISERRARTSTMLKSDIRDGLLARLALPDAPIASGPVAGCTTEHERAKAEVAAMDAMESTETVYPRLIDWFESEALAQEALTRVQKRGYTRAIIVPVDPPGESSVTERVLTAQTPWGPVQRTASSDYTHVVVYLSDDQQRREWDQAQTRLEDIARSAAKARLSRRDAIAPGGTTEHELARAQLAEIKMRAEARSRFVAASSGRVWPEDFVWCESEDMVAVVLAAAQTNGFTRAIAVPVDRREGE